MYLPEIEKGQKYRIGGKDYQIIDIRVTNITSATDFVTGIYFRGKDRTFEVSVRRVIGNPEYQLISSFDRNL